MDREDYVKGIDEEAERRFVTYDVTIEKREDDEENDTVTIEGYAAIFNSRTDLGYYEEEIESNAFDDVMMDDVRALFNHDKNLILARSKGGKGTLMLSKDATGLKYSFKIPDRQYARDLVDAIRSGDVDQSSFAFSVAEEEWKWAEQDEERDLRTIKKFKRLYDVSPVTYPAYQDTSVGMRSLESAKQERADQTEKGATKRSLAEKQLQILKIT